MHKTIKNKSIEDKEDKNANMIKTYADYESDYTLNRSEKKSMKYERKIYTISKIKKNLSNPCKQIDFREKHFDDLSKLK